MNLSNDQKLALAQRISDEFTGFIKSELDYQVEDMKDSDELSYQYYINQADTEDITKLIIDMIAVPVWELSTKSPTGSSVGYITFIPNKPTQWPPSHTSFVLSPHWVLASLYSSTCLAMLLTPGLTTSSTTHVMESSTCTPKAVSLSWSLHHQDLTPLSSVSVQLRAKMAHVTRSRSGQAASWETASLWAEVY